MPPLLTWLLQRIYPLSGPDRHRTQPLQVLALGISRSGTESLRQALVDLGYSHVYHGFDYGSSPNDSIAWIQLGRAQDLRDSRSLRAADFDRVLGASTAVTDIPAAGFAHELLDAYPDAKVILNYREDLGAWVESCQNTIEQVTGLRTRAQWEEYAWTFFQSNLFWRYRSYWWVWTRHFGGNFPQNGPRWYREHYAGLERRLEAEGRGYLRWKVEDGWEPLCEFLGKEVPKRDFPHGNATAEYFKTIEAFVTEWKRQASRNMRLVGATCVVFGVILAGYLYDRAAGKAP